MILFLSEFNDEFLKQYVENFSISTNIPSTYITIPELLNNNRISISSQNNKFTSKINGINFDDIKLCILNGEISFYKELFSFGNELDIEYAVQEWNASLICLFETAQKTKFINRFFKKYNCETEFENIILFQKFGLNTVEMFLTNNIEDFLTIKELFNEKLLIKNILKGYNKSKVYELKDAKKLDKLYLSPYIFQKLQNGASVAISAIGNKYIAYCELTHEIFEIPKGLEEKLSKLKKDLDLFIVTFYALYDNEKYYFYSMNQAFSYSEMFTIYKENFANLFTDFIVKEYES